MRWIYYGLSSEYREHVLGLILAWLENVLGMCWICAGYVLGVCWVCLGFTSAMYFENAVWVFFIESVIVFNFLSFSILMIFNANKSTLPPTYASRHYVRDDSRR